MGAFGPAMMGMTQAVLAMLVCMTGICVAPWNLVEPASAG